MKNLSHRSFFAARFAYCGEHFYGVQEQPNLKTVLGTLREHLTQASGVPIMGLAISARTDRGVNAIMNLATFWIRKPFNENIFLESIPPKRDLLALKVYPVNQNIHARNSSGKIYRYLINDNGGENKNFPWNIVPALDLKAMQQAALFLLGTKDFSSFRGGGCNASTPIKTIHSLKINRIKKNLIAIDIQGNAFLRRMVRNMVGVLIEVGASLRKPEDVPGILEAKNRMAAGICAPARGLTLVKVLYPELESIYASS